MTGKNIYLQHLFVQQAIFLLEILLDPVGRQYLFVINFGSSIIKLSSSIYLNPGTIINTQYDYCVKSSRSHANCRSK
jgi:hypothetical protein